MGLKILDVITDMELENNPMIVHAFSGNGAALYCAICKVADKKMAGTVALANTVKGIIFDRFVMVLCVLLNENESPCFWVV